MVSKSCLCYERKHLASLQLFQMNYFKVRYGRTWDTVWNFKNMSSDNLHSSTLGGYFLN